MSESVILQDDQPVDPDDELLVSFMDGELSQTDRKRVEKRLVDEKNFRERLQSLQTGWEWLDELPEESSSEQLVASTIELVVTDIAPSPSQTKRNLSDSRKPFLVALLCGLGLVGGVSGVVAMRNAELRKEIEDVAIVEHLDAYELGGNDIEFLRELARNPRWSQMLNAQRDVGRLQPPALLGQTDDPDQNLDLIKSLPQNQRRQLESQLKKFRSYAPSRQRSIREIAKSVSQQSDQSTLLATMDAYAQWYDTLTDDQKDGIRSNDSDKRQAAVEDAIESTLDGLLKRSGTMISSENLDQLYFGLTLVWVARTNEDPKLLRSLSEASKSVAIARQVNVDYAAKMLKLVAMSQLVDDRPLPERFRNGISSLIRSPSRSGGPGPSRGPDTGGPNRDGRMSGRDGGRRGVSGFPGVRDSPLAKLFLGLSPITDTELESLTEFLDDETLDDLDSLTNLKHEIDRQFAFESIMRIWCFEAIRRQVTAIEQDNRSMLEKYLSKEEGDRDRLDLLPPDELKRGLDQSSRSFGRR